jgi:hypothetical protein
MLSFTFTLSSSVVEVNALFSFRLLSLSTSLSHDQVLSCCECDLLAPFTLRPLQLSGLALTSSQRPPRAFNTIRTTVKSPAGTHDFVPGKHFMRDKMKTSSEDLPNVPWSRAFSYSLPSTIICTIFTAALAFNLLVFVNRLNSAMAPQPAKKIAMILQHANSAMPHNNKTVPSATAPSGTSVRC